MPLFGLLSNDIAIDLGTANTLIYMRGKGIVLDEPSIVTYDVNSRKIIAIGGEAKKMVGKVHKELNTIRPMRDGVIADFEMAEVMIKEFIKKITPGIFPARKIVVCVPSGITEVEKRAVRDTAEHVGAKEVHLISEPMAAAIGIGLDVHAAYGNMIVDIGGGTTEIAVIALSGITNVVSIKTAGDELTDAIIRFFRSNQNMLIGERTAEDIKCQAGPVMPLEEEVIIEVKGRDLVAGVPKLTEVSSIEIREALNPTVTQIIESMKVALEKTAPELASDILSRGIFLTGGGALLKGLDERIKVETGVPVHIAEDPLTAVVRGTGKVLEDLNFYKKCMLKR